MDDGAPAQVTQRDCEVSLFGDVQKPHGYGPGQPTVDVPAWAAGLDQMTSNHYVFLWFSFSKLRFSNWVSLCWRHWLCSEYLENTFCAPLCYILIFYFIQNCDFQMQCMQINEQLNKDYIHGAQSFFILLKSTLCTHIWRNIFLYFLFISLFVQKSTPFFKNSLSPHLIAYFQLLQHLGVTLSSEKLMLINTLISCYAGGDILLGFFL